MDKTSLTKEINSFFLEDMPINDLTTELLIKETHQSTAVLRSRETIIFCGADIVDVAFSEKMEIKSVSDGTTVEPSGTIATLKGSTKEILIKERVVLNLIQRLSAIATHTNQFVKKLNNQKIKILDTRKTTPGLRQMEKYAVLVGGGANHRQNLSSGILIKDNHLTVSSIARTVEKIKQSNKTTPIQIEIDFIDQISSDLVKCVDGFLLDNMSPQNIKKCIAMIHQYNTENKEIFIEVSGGINLNTITDYNIDGVNGISIGALTHHIKSVDIGLDF